MLQLGRFQRAASVALIALATALVWALAIRLVGADLAKAAQGFLRGAFGSTYALSEILVRATPLLLSGLGVSIGFQAGFFNIGSEGQIYLGAAAATALALACPGLPAPLLIALALAAGFAAGGLWALAPALLKARFGLSEVINTIMFTYIGINIVGILVRTVLKDPAYPLPISPPIPAGFELPILVPGTRLHAGFLVALAAAAAVYGLMRWSGPGFRMRAVGWNPRASRCAGIRVTRYLVLSAFLSGGFAGLAGGIEVAGIHHKLLDGISPGFGYVGIIAALLGRNNPLGIIAAALGLAVLQVGSMSMQRVAGVPSSISWIVMGTLVLLILARPALAAALGGQVGEARS